MTQNQVLRGVSVRVRPGPPEFKTTIWWFFYFGLCRTNNRPVRAVATAQAKGAHRAKANMGITVRPGPPEFKTTIWWFFYFGLCRTKNLPVRATATAQAKGAHRAEANMGIYNPCTPPELKSPFWGFFIYDKQMDLFYAHVYACFDTHVFAWLFHTEQYLWMLPN